MMKRVERRVPSPIAVQAVASEYNFILWSHEDHHVWSKRMIAPPRERFEEWVARALLETYADCYTELPRE